MRERRSPEKSYGEVAEIATCLVPIVHVRRIETQIVCDVRVQVARVEQDVCDGLVDENQLSGYTCIVYWVFCKKHSIYRIKAVEGQSVWISHEVRNVVEKMLVVCRQRVRPVNEECFCSVVSGRDVIAAPILQTSHWENVRYSIAKPFEKW